MKRSIDISSRFRAGILILVFLTVLSYSLADDETAVAGADRALLSALAMIVVAANWLLSERLGRLGRTRSVTVPSFVVYLVIGVALLRGISDAWQQGVQLSTFCEFVVFVLLIKVWDRRSARDDAQIITLCVFLAIGSMLTSVSLAPNALILLGLPLLVGVVMMHQLHASRERALGVPAATVKAGAADAGEQGARSQRTRPEPDTRGSILLPRRGVFLMRTLVGSSIVAAFAISIIVFIVMPRAMTMNSVGGGGGDRSRGAVTSFTDKVELGQGGFISQSQEVVMELEILDEEGKPASPPGSAWYVRGAVLSRYNNGQWVPAERRLGRPGTAATRGFQVYNVERGEDLVLDDLTRGGRRVTMTVRTRGSGSDLPLFTLWRPLSIQLTSSSDRIRFDTRTGVLKSDTNAPHSVYHVTSAAYEVSAVVDEPRETLATFAADPGLREYAATLLRRANLEPDPLIRPRSDDARAVRVMENHLREEFEYTLDVPAADPSMDPNKWFLTVGRRGNCEYFASALAALCQSIGIPARLVTGYAAAEVNPRTGRYTVRESHAHAWVEAHVSGGQETESRRWSDVGWRIYDPTPPETLWNMRGDQRTVFSRLGEMFDAIQVAWNSAVTFDERQRQALLRRQGVDPDTLGSAARRLAGFFQEIGQPREEAEAGRERPGGLIRVVSWSIAGAAALAIGLLAIRVARRTRLRGLGVPVGESVPAYYAAVVESLGKRGFVKPSWQTPMEYLATVEAKAAPPEPVMAACRRAVDVFYRERFAGIAETAQTRALVRSQVLEAVRAWNPTGLKARSGRAKATAGRAN
ncbi:MAG: DUF3488 and transglutaminase-like domain-containing protein [Planctomycetota bacterium]|nr:DUF3488 and transglutaminase-like domain-containing protein [Planctomycetota bacterium]